MLKLMGIVIKYLLLAALTVLLYHLAQQYHRIWAGLDFDVLWPYGLASAAFVAMYFLFLRRRLEFWEVFFHELTHVFFALLFLNRIQGFSASMSGGVTGYSGRSNFLIRLSPYLFPIQIFPFMILYFLLQREYPFFLKYLGAGANMDVVQSVLKYLIAVGYTWYLAALFFRFSFGQKDVTESGRIFSILLVIQVNIIGLLFVVFVLQDGPGTLFSLLHRTILTGIETWKNLLF